jgi:heat shock protein HtpX
MTLYAHKNKNIQKTWLLMTLFFGFVVGLGYVLSGVYQNINIFYGLFAFSLIMNTIAYWYSDKIAIAQSGAKLADENEYRELHQIVENLAITAGLPKPKVFIINDSAPNAFATGRDPKHSSVAVTTGLLNILDRSELEGVIAHELAHIGNRDILLSTVAIVLVGFITLLADFISRISFFGNISNSNNENRSIGALHLVIVLIVAILAPIGATLLQLAISRKREYLADASGALLTRYPEGLANALRKIGSYSVPMEKASKATAHMYISNPFGASGKVSHLFMTHPPIQKRIDALMQKSYEKNINL